MAREIRCDFCQSEEALGMWSLFADGSTVAVGVDCRLAFIGGLAQAFGLVPATPDEPSQPDVPPQPDTPHTGDNVLGDGGTRPRKRARPGKVTKDVDSGQSTVDDVPECVVCGAVYPDGHDEAVHAAQADPDPIGPW